MKKILVVMVCLVSFFSVAQAQYTFGQWAQDVGLSQDATQAIAHHNAITSLAGINNYPNLTLVQLGQNLLTQLNVGDFANLNDLQELHLYENQITDIEPGSFSNLHDLNWMSISDNQISTIQSNTFTGLTSLPRLQLQRNSINNIESGAFSGLDSLGYLHLEENFISRVEIGDFIGLDNMQYLYLQDNQISSIESGCFSGLHPMWMLDLHNNQLHTIQADSFIGMRNLRFLYLQNNQTTRFEDRAFTDLRSLTYLYLDDNPMQELNFTGAEFEYLTDIYARNTNITRLNLSQADLRRDSFYYMLSDLINQVDIMDLNLSDAKLPNSAASDINVITYLTSLENLDISNVQYYSGIIDENYQPIVDAIAALDDDSLSHLTIDPIIYGAQQQYFDDWDALPGHTLTIVPEPSMIMLLTLGYSFLLKRKSRK